mgnify:CR=1 FL=1
MVRFMTWSQSVVTWNLNAWTTVVDVHWLYKLHIFLGLVITMLFPFTRLVHIWSGFAAPFRYLLTRPGYQIVRSRRSQPLAPRKGPVTLAKTVAPKRAPAPAAVPNPAE